MQKNINDILVIRNDKIGDFILILPALSWIKKNIPNCNITCIVSENVSDIAEQCKLIDSVCIGCYRTTEEITMWSKYTDKQREEIIREIQSSRCQVLSNN